MRKIKIHPEKRRENLAKIAEMKQRERIDRGLYTLADGTKKWVYGNYKHEAPFQSEDGTVQFAERHIIDTALGLMDVDPESVGAYIGITDTSMPPKKIYEGDIIEDESGIRHLVRYNPSKARYEAVLLPKSTWHRWDIAGDIGQDWVTEFGKKVIGSMHTNPEML